MTQIQHTPTPFEDTGNNEIIKIQQAITLETVAFLKPDYPQNKANAAFIVNARNYHDELVGLANAAMEAWEYMKNDPRLLTHERKAAESWFNHARELLKKASEL